MHDFTPHESGAPRRITPAAPSDYFEVLTRAVFNAGMSWQVVQAHWPAIAEALADFDPDIVAGYDEQDVARLVADERLIQSPGKISAVPDNARAFVRLVGEHDSFDAWLAGVGDYDARERALRRRFRYIGEFGAYWAQYTLSMDVPDYRDWARSRGRTLPAALRGAE